MIRKLWPGLAALGAMIVFSGWAWRRLPARVASHWDIHGAVNGWMPRTVFVLLVPAIAVAVAGIVAIAPHLDPKRRNFPLHAGAYWTVGNAVLLLLAVVQVLIIGYNLGWPIDIGRVTGLGVGALFVVIGNVLTRVRPNWIFGVRTPWTLSSELSWRETHRIAGYLFVVVGLVALATAVVRPHAVTLVIVIGAIGSSLFAVIWSYFAWKHDPNALGRDA